MFGRGVMKWVNGDLFDGSWLNGYRHGSGVYRFSDGNYYFGTWTKGLKDGQRTFYPAGSKCSSFTFRKKPILKDSGIQNVMFPELILKNLLLVVFLESRVV